VRGLNRSAWGGWRESDGGRKSWTIYKVGKGEERKREDSI